MENLLKDMGKRIFDRRKQLNMTQETLAELAHVTPQTISTAELGQKAMRPETILKVCDALHISTEYLLRGVITEADSSLLMKKISTLTPKQYRHFEDILDSFIAGIGAPLAPMPLLIIPCCGTQTKYWQSGCVSYRPFPDHRPLPVQPKASQALQASPPIWLWESAPLLFPVPYLPAAKSL